MTLNRFALTSLAAVLVFASLAIAQTSITIRSAANLTAGKPVRLADIADVQGPEAERLREAVVVNDAQSVKANFADGFAVSVESVRDALSRLPQGVNWGKVTLGGSACFIRGTAEPVVVPVRPEPTEATPLRSAPVQVVSTTDQLVPRGVIARRLAGLFSVSEEDLRLKLAASNRNDEAWLDAPLNFGAASETGSSNTSRVEVQPGASTASGRVPLRVDVYQGGRLTETRTFTAEVQTRREVVVTGTTLDRDQAIDQQDIRIEARWLSPSGDSPASPEQVAGSSAKRKLEAGRVVMAGDLQTPVVVQKGETVWVHCLSGSFVVKSKARSLEAGRDGQLVKLQADGVKKPFLARMSGKGVAVIELAPSLDLQGVFRGTPSDGPAQRVIPNAPAAGSAGTAPGSAVPAPNTLPDPATVRGRALLPRLPAKK